MVVDQMVLIMVHIKRCAEVIDRGLHFDVISRALICPDVVIEISLFNQQRRELAIYILVNDV